MKSGIDLAITKAEATAPQVHKLVTDAMQQGLGGVCVSTAWTARVARMVQGSGVKVCSFVGFPLGMSKATIKAIEATGTIKDGADCIEVAAHLPHLVNGDLDAAKAELTEIVRAARSTRRDVVINIVVESALLMQAGGERAIEIACRAARESGCDGVVTASGFHPAGGASIDAIALLKKHGESLTIKAAGGIESLEAAEPFFIAGADRAAIGAMQLIV